jgi:hypothetical protein
MYKFIRVGIFIVDKNGKEYTGEEWEHFRDDEDVDEQDRVVNEDAILLKVVTSTLAAYNGIFGVDIDHIRILNYDKTAYKWCSNGDTYSFTSVPFANITEITSSNIPRQEYMFNGFQQSILIKKESADFGITVPAISKCLTYQKVLAENTKNE